MGSLITACATVLLVFVGIAQILALQSQKRQIQLQYLEEYRKQWNQCKIQWGKVVYIGRNLDEYYQVLPESAIVKLQDTENEYTNSRPTTWALDAARATFSLFSDICIKILSNQMTVSDVYPVWGTELLRQSRPIRNLLDSLNYQESQHMNHRHTLIRNEVQQWLIYHEGIRRRSLILIDLLWAEAARLNDLPPGDLESAANAKIQTGNMNRKRLINEHKLLNGAFHCFSRFKLAYFLKHSEYKNLFQRGIDKKQLAIRTKNWTNHLLKNCATRVPL